MDTTSTLTADASPDHDFEQARALFLEGLGHAEACRWADAARCFEASLVCVPGRASTLVNLAAARLELGQPQQALDALDEVLALEPAHAAAAYHRGLMLGRLERHGEALVAFEQLLVREPGRGELWWRHAQAALELERVEQALASFDKAVSLAPDLAEAWSQRGALLKDMGRLDDAADSLRQALARGAEPAVNAYWLASATGRDAPATAPPHYVQTLFDGYAAGFDQHLVEVLHYQAPQVLADGLAALLAAQGAWRPGSALDLGCGTGLCAPRVKPLLAAPGGRIDGIDLSAGMLDRARARAVYDELIQSDIVPHLDATAQRYDLVLATDVFIYIGDLAAVFAGVRRVLTPGGLYCFSVELADDAHDFELRPSSRYAHSERYLLGLAAAHGFAPLQTLRRPIREDQARPTAGLYLYLRSMS